MDKNAIKKYAVWARRELIARVTQKAEKYEITEQNMTGADADSIGGRVLTSAEKKQRRALIEKIKADGFEQVMEEVAYTWFNRFTALRFMEVNNYLPSHTRVFTNEEGAFKPQILADAISLELEGLDMEKVYELKDTNKTEELYRYLLITQCNALSSILPQMFQKIEDYTELLLPDYLLREGSVIEQMIALIPEEDWTDQVQIIGWLYQYYNSEKKDDVFAALKKNVKITKENIPAATQLFTPDWIVRYMVENSLGRLWLEGHPDVKEQLLPTEEEQSAYAAGSRDSEDSKWHYYLEEAEQEPEVQAKLAEIRKEYAALKPEEIKCIDPCSGSGHILAYMFDVLMKIYESYGYTSREAVGSIVENNLYGLDIDERAAQLAYFAVMMKARQYDRRFFNRKDEDGNLCIPQPHVYAIAESGHTDADGKLYKNYDEHAVEYFCNGDAALKEAMDTIIQELHDAKEYGSILTVTLQDWKKLYARFDEIREDIHMYRDVAVKELLPLVQVTEALGQKYDAVVTNPPYMGSSGMSAKLSDFVKKNYSDSKSDLFAVFIERCGQIAQKNGYQAMITQHAWMFLSSFEKLRGKLLATDIVNMAHLGARAFEEIGGEVVQTTSFVMRKSHIADYKGIYSRLIEPTSQQGKEDMFLAGTNRYATDQTNFSKIPGSPVAYWVNDNVFSCFVNGKAFEDIGHPRVGMQTSNNDKFLRLWSEVRFDEFSSDSKKWIKYIKGGSFRRWYGNLEYVVWYNSTPSFILQQKNARVLPESELTMPKCTWTDLATSRYSCRIAPNDSFHDISGHCFYPNKTDQMKLLALTNTVVFQLLIDLLNSSLHYQVGDVARIPVLISLDENITTRACDSVEKSKSDWDSYETSWDFKRHPMLNHGNITEAYTAWKSDCEARFLQLKVNEEELNRIFIDIYGLQDELSPDVADKDVTVHRVFDTKDDVPESMKGSNYVRTLRDEVVSFISYAVGCMFGRYSLHKDGIVYAGGDWSEKYGSYNGTFDDLKEYTFAETGNFTNGELSKKFCYLRSEDKKPLFCYHVDYDNIIPICDDEYFEDDIVGLFVKFVKTVYGEDTLEENLKFIADALGGKGTSREVIRKYFMDEFYKDHCKTYQKRPIYWLFDSGKKNGFKCLIYMHRYQPDTIARIRTDYVHEQQSRYRTAIAGLESRIDEVGTSERVKLKKQLDTLQAQATEIREYEEKIHHLADQMIHIDLDDGVKANYAKFQDVLAKIK